MSFPRRVAHRLKQQIQSSDIKEITSLLHIDYYEFPLAGRVKGFAGKLEGQAYIVVKEGLPTHWKRAVAFHELGHVLLHDTLGYFFIAEHTLFSPGKLERQANEFAAEYLIPDDMCHGDIRMLAEELEIPVALFKFKRPLRGGVCCI